MAYRRKAGSGGLNPRPSSHPPEVLRSPPEADEPSSLAAKAIRASTARRDSSLSSAYEGPVFSNAQREPSRSQDTASFQYTSTKKLNESKYGFWDVLAQKAKTVLDEKHGSQQDGKTDKSRTNTNSREESTSSQPQRFYGHRKIETPKIQKGLDAIASSLNYIGGRVGNALEEGISIVENRTADIIQETRKLNIRRKGSGSNVPKDQNHSTYSYGRQYSIPPVQADQEIQLKAARDVANAMAAKAKLLMRELKTVKADLAFAKERCAQLEEENKILRESYEKGGHPEDDELIRLQLETLLAEKARLAHENSTYARENRFLREIVEYHQLTMQDVVYLDEGIEEVSEVYPTPSAHVGSGFSFQSSSVPWSSTSNAASLSVPLPATPTPMSSSVQSVPKPPAATLSLST